MMTALPALLLAIVVSAALPYAVCTSAVTRAAITKDTDGNVHINSMRTANQTVYINNLNILGELQRLLDDNVKLHKEIEDLKRAAAPARWGTSSVQQKLTASDAEKGDFFGRSVALSGTTAIVGAYNNDGAGTDSGSAYIFEKTGTSWVQQQNLTASDAAAGDNFAYSVAISGTTAVVGAYHNNDAGTDSGSAYIFEKIGTSWVEQQKLTASDAAAGDYFGSSVAVSGTTAIVGAYGNDDSGTDSGSAYIFEKIGTSWVERQKLTASDAAASDYFGISVAVSGTTAIVAAHFNDDAGSNSGSAYVFEKVGTSWTEQQKLTASDAAAGDAFGNAVAVSGSTAIVAAYGNDDGGSGSGSAYIFEKIGTSWVEQQKLTASDAAGADVFGSSVAVSGTTAIVGATGNADAGVSSGSAYIFEKIGTSWVEQQKLTASDATLGDVFGNAVAVSGTTAIVGANGNDDGGSNSGSAYIFEYVKELLEARGSEISFQ